MLSDCWNVILYNSKDGMVIKMCDLEEKLRDDFLKALGKNNRGDVVDDLINVLKKDYILLVKEPLNCRDCVNFHDRYGWISPFYCMFYQRKITDLSDADCCSHYFSGGLEARKSLARVHNDLTGDLFYK